jgi:A/G-specific adenine glycosylase
VSAWCAARAAGTERDRPARTSKHQPRVATFALAVLHTAGRVLLERRPAGGLLGGMWAFPERQVADAGEAVATAADLARERGFDLVRAAEAVTLPTCSHRFTHLAATYWPAALEVAHPHAEGRNAVWIEIDRPSPVALPAAQRRVLASLPQCLAAPVVAAERGEA